MKKVLLATFLSFFCFSIAKAQNPTYADIPDSSHVLVVYNSLSDTSKFVKNYYVNARGIPESNIVGLDGLYDDWITDPATGVPHYIKLEQGEDGEKEKIVDQQRAYCPMYRHAWLYFNERIAIPISNKLKTTNENGDTLKNIIRFIVLCKGVPFRIVTGTEYSESCNQNVPVDALLCFLGETIDNPDALLNYFNDECTAPDPLPPCVGSYGIENPYYNVDPNFSMDHHFIPNHYSKYNSHFGRDIALSYLITHLDATSLDIVENMIDSSIVAINSTNYDWFIDSDPSPCKGTSFILHPSDTEDAFEDLEITNYFIEYSDDVYTNHNKPIMSYSSNGIHTSENPNDKCDLYFPENYIQTQLDFTYIAGSVFNTAESFNANTLGTFPIIRGANHGQLPEFFLKGGTVGVGQVKHGTNGGIIISNKIMMPSYALGYSFIEAAYLGMKNLTDNRIIVGDPLTRIYDCPEQILTGTLNSGTYSCRIIVPEGGTLTIPSGAIVNFERNGSFRILGTLIINENAVLNFYNKSTWKCFENGKIIIDPGVTVNLNDKSLFSCYGSFISNGTASNFAKFNIRNFDKKMSFNNSDTINVSFTTIKKGKFDISKDLSSQIFTDILFQDCVFDSCITPIDILDPQKLSQFKIINNQLTNTEGFGIRIDGSQLGDISNVNIGSIDFSLSRSGIDINEVDSLDVYNAIIMLKLESYF